MTELQEKQLKLLNETVQYYTEDPSRRCRVIISCSYSPKTLGKINSDGCAIGRLLTNELKEELDRDYKNIGVKEIFKLLPIEIQSYGIKFLGELQQWHDSVAFWSEDGLNDRGRKIIIEMESLIYNNEYVE